MWLAHGQSVIKRRQLVLTAVVSVNLWKLKGCPETKRDHRVSTACPMSLHKPPGGLLGPVLGIMGANLSLQNPLAIAAMT